MTYCHFYQLESFEFELDW